MSTGNFLVGPLIAGTAAQMLVDSGLAIDIEALSVLIAADADGTHSRTLV
jgi:hypothetical protein